QLTPWSLALFATLYRPAQRHSPRRLPPSSPPRRSSDLRLRRSRAVLRRRADHAARRAPGARVSRRARVADRARPRDARGAAVRRSEEHTSALQSRVDVVCRLLSEDTKMAWGARAESAR